ncbi:MAG: hypothetical protein GXP25_01970 [Planctomycetes bacterium]|nr:hypothetical protein [Planctomycetota bacterium]
MIFELVKDFAAALEAMPADHPKRRMLQLLEEAIRRDIHFIERHPTTLFHCLWNLCWWYDSPEAGKHYEEPDGGWEEAPPWEREGEKLFEFLERRRAEKEERTPGFRWVRSLRPPSVHLGTAQRAVFRGHEDVVNSVSYSPDGSRIVSGGGMVRCACGTRRRVSASR